jgi:hypothetical protein
MTATILRPSFGSRPRPVVSAETQAAAVKTIRLTGLAAVNGNASARKVLTEFCRLANEPLYSETARAFLAHIGGIADFPSDVNPEGPEAA